MTFQPGAAVYTQGFGTRPESVEVPHYDVRAPVGTDVGPFFPIGKRWIFVGTAEYVLLSLSVSQGVTTANWSLLGTDTGSLATLSDGSTTVTPTAGNIEILGTPAEITSTGTNSPGAITLSLPSAVTTPGSLTTTTTLAVGTNATVAGTLGVTGATTLGTVAATNGTFSGTLGVTGLTTLGALTQVGTASINASGAGVTTIGTGGTGAVDIGNATGNTAITGTLTSSGAITATTGGITASAGGASVTGTTTINTTGAATTSIGTGGTGAVNIGNATGGTAVSGSLSLPTAGGKLIIHDATAGSDSVGVTTLVGGTSTVHTTAIDGASLVFVSVGTPGGTQGFLSVPPASYVSGTSFVINSSNVADISTVNYWIIN
jgi:hypothetical protein